MSEAAASRPKVLLSAGMIQQGQSGVGRYVVELARRLAGMGVVELHLAGLEQDRHLFESIDAAHWWAIPPRCRGGPMNLLWHQVCLPGLLRREGFDLLHIPSYRRIVALQPGADGQRIHPAGLAALLPTARLKGGGGVQRSGSRSLLCAAGGCRGPLSRRAGAGATVLFVPLAAGAPR